jgi:prepilin-type N-terminal cleavage/methylation domain-containing protein
MFPHNGCLNPFRGAMGKEHQQAFTLIELSIVLVIIGLLVGGVLAGHEMTVQAELRRVVKDVERYKTAVSAFRDKYNCIPGDCSNATKLFGVSSTGCHVPAPANGGELTAAGGTGTCNGDGDGIVYNAPARANGYSSYEPMLVWNHLWLAGMVSGGYNGVQVAANGYFGLQAGINVPYTIRNGGIDMMTYCLGLSGSCTLTNAFVVGGPVYSTPGPGDYSGGGLLTTAESLSLDTKFDDGLPNTGNITGGPWGGWGSPTDCMIASNVSSFASGNAYDLTKTSPVCGLYFSFPIN